MRNLILDTCALLWLAADDPRFSAEAKDAVSKAPFAFVSAISGFEIGLKTQRGKLQLPATTDQWFGTVASHHGLTVLDITLADALRAPQLLDVHKDPCDRFIIAAAERLGVPVVTADRVFGQYGIPVIQL
jgi:PIN domain nuclease of toxin-antitoxin system